jgi:hypothetical protein
MITNDKIYQGIYISNQRTTFHDSEKYDQVWGDLSELKDLWQNWRDSSRKKRRRLNIKRPSMLKYCTGKWDKDIFPKVLVFWRRYLNIFPWKSKFFLFWLWLKKKQVLFILPQRMQTVYILKNEKNDSRRNKQMAQRSDI